MKKLFTFMFLSLSLIWFISSKSIGQNKSGPIKTTIEDIVDNPGKYYDEAVAVQGYVSEFLEKPSTTNSFYMLKGKYDGIIQVRVQFNEPSVGHKYLIEGTVYKSENNDLFQTKVFIHQTGIAEIYDFSEDWKYLKIVGSKSGLAGKYDAVSDTPPEIPEEPPVDHKTRIFTKENILIGAIIIIVIAIIVVVVIMFTKKESSTPQPYSPTGNTPIPSPITKPTPPSGDDDNEYKTIKIVRDPSRTLKFVPGELEIISGEDAGKSFRLTGFPTSSGSVITLGTQDVEGDRKFAHILIDKKFRTVSRKQAELIFKESENKMYIKNLSRTNYTEVDGVKLNPNEIIELKSGSVIKTGELEFRYTV